MKGSVPPTWSGAFTYVSTTSSLTWIVERPHDLPRRRHHHRCSQWLARRQRPHRRDDLLFLSLLGRYRVGARLGRRAARARPRTRKPRKQISPRSSKRLQGRVPLSQGAMVAATTSSGTGGGSGGGSGSCLRAGTVVLTKERGTVAIESCNVGEHLRCPVGRRRRSMDAHCAPRSARRGHVHPPAFLERGIARRDAAPHLHARRRLADARRAPLPERRIRRPLRPHHAEAHRGHRPSRRRQRAKKVTVSCEPTHQFFAGHHAATILTHNYTFSS